MAIVYAWPDVAPREWRWSVDDPLSSSSSIITGRRYASQSERRRRVARLVISGSRSDWGGRMEAMKRLIQGGANYVRLWSRPMLYALPDAERVGDLLSWRTDVEVMSWTTAGREPMVWLTGRVIEVVLTTVDGLPAARLSGLPASQTVALPGEPISFYAAVGDPYPSESRTILRELVSDGDGVATAVLDKAATHTGRADIGIETGVFKALDIPDPSRVVGEEWYYDWMFREVFSDEVGGFEEINPWV
jgi:hypothetical protein